MHYIKKSLLQDEVPMYRIVPCRGVEKSGQFSWSLYSSFPFRGLCCCYFA